jgi:hypothetical protein
MIARGNTPEKCQQNVNVLKARGWTPITEVKLDPSPTIDISYVCVLEREDGKRVNEWSEGKKRFNRSFWE